MRGEDVQQTAMFSYVSPEERVPKDHPLRAVRAMVDDILKQLSPRFSRMYAKLGRPSIPPEKLLRALVIQVLYTVRSERMLMEQLEYNLLFRWFVGLNVDEATWNVTVFTKNRKRLLKSDVAKSFFALVMAQAEDRGLVSNEHFTVDGTLIEAWASHKSFRKKDDKTGTPPDNNGNPGADFHGQKRTNETHESRTDAEARLYRKGRGKEAKLCYMGHVLMENRNGLAVAAELTHATGTAERKAALSMLKNRPGVTVGGDKGYDVRSFVEDLRRQDVTPHVAQRIRASAIDGRTTRHPGYIVSQRKRKRVEEIFGWLKTIGGFQKTKFRGRRLVSWMFTFGLAVYNLMRIRNLSPQVTG